MKELVDSIEWNFLHKCLDVFNYGSDFKKWVALLYTDISSCVSNNGVHSDFFALERGVRQGDPLSPYLFIAAVEILAIAIRTNNSIRGISIGDQEYKLAQYADDTTGILKDEESLKVFLDVLKSYEKVSGLKINISKSECMWIRASRNCKREVLRPVARIFYGWVRSVDYTDQRAPEALFTRGVRGHAPPGNFEN